MRNYDAFALNAGQVLGGSSFFRPLWDNLQYASLPSYIQKSLHFAQVFVRRPRRTMDRKLRGASLGKHIVGQMVEEADGAAH